MIPKGWELVRLGDLGTEIRKSVKPMPGVEYEMYSVPAFPLGQPEILLGEEIKSSKRQVEPGDLLLCKINPRINRVWWVDSSGQGRPQLASTEYLVLRLPGDRRDLLRYLVWYLRSPEFRKWIELHVEGATGSHTRAKSPAILEQLVPIAPPVSRDRIVEELEKHATRLESGTRSLRRIQLNARGYRRALLEAAVQGRLHPGSDPDSWTMVRVEEVAEVFEYGSSAKARADIHGIPVLRMGNIDVTGRVVSEDLKFIPFEHPDVVSRYELKSGDLLFNRTNSPELVGKTAVYRGEPERCLFASYLIRVRLRDECAPEYLSYVTNSPFGRRWIKSVVSQQVGQANVSGGKYKKFAFPLPPRDYQDAAIDIVESQLSILDEALGEVGKQLLRSESLNRSILSGAFSGRLLSVEEAEVA